MKDGNEIGATQSNVGPLRLRSFERLLNGEDAADYDGFLKITSAHYGHHAVPTIRSYLAIDAIEAQDSGSYQLMVKQRHNPKGESSLAAAANVTVTKGKSKDHGETLSSQLPTVHYPHPMAPVFIRAFPDKVFVDAGDNVQLGCRLWGLPNSLVSWTS